MRKEIINGIILLFLIINGWLDWKKHEISLLSVLGFGVTGIITGVVFTERAWGEILSGAAMGFLLILTAFFTKEAIGFGDGLILIVVGLWIGFWRTLQVLASGLVTCTVFTGIRILRKGMPNEERIPFVPYLLIAFAGDLLI